MNKDLIELQRGCHATAVVVFNNEVEGLENFVIMKAKVSDKFLFGSPVGNPIFKEMLEEKSKLSGLVYFVIYGIDEVSTKKQERFLGIVKDREFEGYKLPQNCIIVFTVNDKNSLKKISNELFHFCIVA